MFSECIFKFVPRDYIGDGYSVFVFNFINFCFRIFIIVVFENAVDFTNTETVCR